LADGAAERAVVEVGERACGRREWERPVMPDVGGVQHRGPVDADADVAPVVERRQLGIAVIPGEEAVDGRSREVAEDGGRAARLDGGEEAAVAGRVGMADGVHAAMESVEVALRDPDLDRAMGQTAGIEEVIDRDDTPLAARSATATDTGRRSRDPYT
jgi:hypothetical protein